MGCPIAVSCWLSDRSQLLVISVQLFLRLLTMTSSQSLMVSKVRSLCFKLGSLCSRRQTAGETAGRTLVILSEGHQLCERCRNYLCKLDKMPVVKRLINTNAYHQSLSALHTAVRLPCYICATIYEEPASEHSTNSFEATYFYNIWLYARVPYLFVIEHGPTDHKLPSLLSMTAFAARKVAPPDLHLSHEPTISGEQPEEKMDRHNAAQRWMTNCLQEHGECAEASTVIWHPSRLLDVVDVRLILTSEEPVVGPYATLSYRWGDNPSFSHSRRRTGRILRALFQWISYRKFSLMLWKFVVPWV